MSAQLEALSPGVRRIAAARTASRPGGAALVVFLAAHAPLALLMRNVPGFAFAHAMGCFVYGVYTAATTTRPAKVATVVSYMAGAEVLWRMCHTDVFWEFGKYAIAAILLIAILRCRDHRRMGLPLAYFCLLLPSIALTMSALDISNTRDQISSTLSGPMMTAVAVIFFSRVRLDTRAIRTAFLALLAPVLGIAALAIVKTQAASHLEFVNGSNRVTSGGFGPNQVSAMLGLAAMMLILISLDRQITWRKRVFAMGLAAVLAMQTALTFARGGLLLALAGAACAALLLSRANARTRIVVVVVGALLGSLGAFVIAPQLDEVTGGKIALRYQSTKTSGRDVLAASELRMFALNPALGVGPGVGLFMRDEMGAFSAASHTEYTRMLGEHGVLGLLSLCCLVLIAMRAIRGATEPYPHAVAAALVLWAFGFLAIYSTRLAAPGLALGLACACRPRPNRAAIAPPLP